MKKQKAELNNLIHKLNENPSNPIKEFQETLTKYLDDIYFGNVSKPLDRFD